jgi:hypothetical protein
MKKYVYYAEEIEGLTEVTVTPKEYWDDNGHVADYDEDEIIDFFENIGFDNISEATFVSDLSVSEVNNILASHSMFVQDLAFNKFMKKHYN